MLSIAVLIPTYDRPVKLERALRSCFEQRVTPGQVVVVDNGVNPETPKVVERFQAQHGERVVYERTEPRNVRAALGRGIDLLQGEWCTQLDDDDYFVPGRFERDLQILPTLAPDVVLLAHHFLRVDYAERIAWIHRVDPAKLTLQNALCFDHFGPLAMGTWRTATVQAHHPFRLEAGVPDYDWIAALMFHGRAEVTDAMSYVQDDTRGGRGPRITSTGNGMIRSLEIHRERYHTQPAAAPVDRTYLARRIDQQLAFHAGKSLRARALGSPQAGAVWRHPVEFAKGLLSPLRPRVGRLLAGVLPEFRGSAVWTFEKLAREQPELTVWIRQNELA